MGNAGDMHLPKGRAALIKLGTKQKKHPQAKSEGVQITMVAGQDLLKALPLKSGYKGVAGAVTIICNLILRFLTK
ncbi:MAG: hypothetical protein KC447_06000 [Rhodobacteraceae bacterium]|nr:hypothetical protein [Paracoccaceae bacterium]